jgi:ribosomal protein S12 methylthiotransferase
MIKKTFYLETLGCAKNSVDSASMEILLKQAGFSPTDSQSKAEILIVNTCGFIQAAREESYQVLNELARHKKPGQILIAAGCLTERYRSKVAHEVKGIDGIVGTRRWMDILELIQKIKGKDQSSRIIYHLPDAPKIGEDIPGLARSLMQGKSAYLKIADGCRRSCAFCAIPLIKGTAVSRSPEAIIVDALRLQKEGVQEIILIAQDSTDYGSDLGLKDGLVHLLERLIPKVPNIPWIRILYTYPGLVNQRLIDLMTHEPQLIPYLDMPLQHAHPELLRCMHRPDNVDWVHRTIEKMRANIPGLALRTTMIVGFPGETETEFQTLLDFIAEIRFDHLGAFPYSFEEGTPAEKLGDPVPQELKLERLERLMVLQEQISLEINQSFIGKRLPVLIEGYNEGISVGRSYRDAPEIDGLVFVEGKAPIDEIVPVTINSALTHDLIGSLTD